MSARDRILKTLEDDNPGIDAIGPLDDYLFRPVGQEIDALDERLDKVKGLFSSNYDPSRTDEEIDEIVSGRSIIRDPGVRGSTNLSLIFITAPDGFSIPSGTIASTRDALYQYVLTSGFAPSSVEVEEAFNPDTGYYEFPVPISAVEEGEKYNISANRITKLNASLPPGSRVINKAPITNGRDRETNEHLWTRYQDAGTLNDLSSKEGISTQLRRAYPEEIKGVYVPDHFTPVNPLTEKPGIQFYIIGDTPVEVSETLPINDYVIQLTHSYVDSVSRIVVNDQDIVSYTLSGNRISITEPLLVTATSARVTYIYNDLLEKSKAFLDARQNAIFGYSLAALEAIPEDLELDITVKIQRGVLGRVQSQDFVETLSDYFNQLYFTEEDLTLLDINEVLKSNFNGIVSTTINKFSILSRQSFLTGFPIFIEPPRYPRLLQENTKVTLVAG